VATCLQAVLVEPLLDQLRRRFAAAFGVRVLAEGGRFVVEALDRRVAACGERLEDLVEAGGKGRVFVRVAPNCVAHRVELDAAAVLGDQAAVGGPLRARGGRQSGRVAPLVAASAACQVGKGERGRCRPGTHPEQAAAAELAGGVVRHLLLRSVVYLRDRQIVAALVRLSRR
jgi:hypothetical protein